MKGPDLDQLRSEGELNISPRRQAWQQEQLDGDTKYWLEEDGKYFLHQSLSTPCLDVLTRCKGAWLEDLQGKRFLDFHGNSVHQVGFGHPRVVQAIREQMETLPFCTRRYTNIPAIKLARKLTQLAPGSQNKVLFAPGGAGAVGIALKLARMANRSIQDVVDVGFVSRSVPGHDLDWRRGDFQAGHWSVAPRYGNTFRHPMPSTVPGTVAVLAA